MGIRIHKFLGYGLTDVKHRKMNIADSRINKKSPLFDWEKDSTSDYLDWVTRKLDNDPVKAVRQFNLDSWLTEDELKDYRVRIGNTIVYQGEYGLPNVLVIQGLSYTRQWQRYDDSIDWIEETYLRRGPDSYGSTQINWVELLPEGPHPYSGLFMDARTGERIEDNVAITWRRTTWPSVTIDEADRDKLAKILGFTDAKEADEVIVPLVPQEIRDLCEWGHLFTNDDIWKQLRPMLYTYWS